MKGSIHRSLALTRKELFSTFNSPVAYGVIVFFLLFTSLWFFYVQRFFAMDSASLRSYFSVFPVIFTIIIPAITMKSWAEERKTGTAELLLTMPFSEWELVIGKFLSAYTVMFIALLLTLPVPLSLLPLGHFDGGAIVGEYLGALLLAAVATSAGLLFSALSKNQVSAFLGSLIILLIITLINQVTSTFDVSLPLAALINYLSLAFHFESFSKGVIDTRDLAYFILITALLLFINTRVILFRKWS